jgi:hypothetical protein
MSELIHDKIVKELLTEIVGKPERNSIFSSTILDNYLVDIGNKAGLLYKSGANIEEVAKFYSGEYVDIISKALTDNNKFKTELYKKTYEELTNLLNEGGDYFDLLNQVYEDEVYLNEIFVRIVEEKEKVAITSSKQLQEITNIYEIYGYYEEDEKEVIPYGKNKPTKKEAQEIATTQINETFINAMSFRYSQALENILKAGGNYEELLKLKPSFFYLPENWKGSLTTNQYTSICLAVKNVFYLDDLRAIAKEIGAPYSLLIDIKLSGK